MKHGIIINDYFCGGWSVDQVKSAENKPLGYVESEHFIMDFVDSNFIDKYGSIYNIGTNETWTVAIWSHEDYSEPACYFKANPSQHEFTAETYRRIQEAAYYGVYHDKNKLISYDLGTLIFIDQILIKFTSADIFIFDRFNKVFNDASPVTN